jgi:uncharacterized protein (TIGR03435 family)
MLGPMLQFLLEETFRLKLHKELRNRPGYILTVDRTGPEFSRTEPGSCIQTGVLEVRPDIKPDETAQRYCGSGPIKAKGRLMAFDLYGISMADFATRIVSTFAELPVVDNTGLKGLFDIHFEAMRRPAMPSGQAQLNGVNINTDLSQPSNSADDPEGETLSASLQKLGLKLSSAKAEAEVLVVDHVEKLPE